MKKILLIATVFIAGLTAANAQTPGTHVQDLTIAENANGTTTYAGKIAGLGNKIPFQLVLTADVNWDAYACINPGNHNVEAQGGPGGTTVTAGQTSIGGKNGATTFTITTPVPTGTASCPNVNWALVYDGLIYSNPVLTVNGDQVYPWH